MVSFDEMRVGTKFRLKNDKEITGEVIGSDLIHGNHVWVVQWSDVHFQSNYTDSAWRNIMNYVEELDEES